MGVACEPKQHHAHGSLTESRKYQVKPTRWVSTVLTAALLAFSMAGCKRQASQPQTLEEGLTQLQAALVKASPEVQNNFYNGVQIGIRYDKYADALAALGRIASDPSLNPQQKKLVAEVTALMQAKIQSQQNAPKPGQ